MATSVTGQDRSHITNKANSLRFLVDTGAEVSIIPPCGKDLANPSPLTPQAVNNTTIPIRSLTLNLGLCRPFYWVFVIANIKTPILGADFLRHYGLLVDMSSNRFIDTLTSLQVQVIMSSEPSIFPSLLPKHTTSRYESILYEFPTIVQPFAPLQPTKHDITQHILTNRSTCPRPYTSSLPRTF